MVEADANLYFDVHIYDLVVLDLPSEMRDYHAPWWDFRFAGLHKHTAVDESHPDTEDFHIPDGDMPRERVTSL